MSNRFWEFSLSTYAADGVASAALAVQEELGVDINIILYASWLAELGLKLTYTHAQGLESHIARWRKEVVIPLRAARRAVRADLGSGVLYDELKAVELNCEKHQQQMMWEYFQVAKVSEPLMPASDVLGDNLDLIGAIDAPKSASWKLLKTTIFNALAK